VADLAGIPLERVRRFEGPVLAERAFMAERAQNTQVRRAGETHGPKLGDVVRERLAQREPDHDSTQWDSWRRDDGVWTVRLIFRIGGLAYEATWAFDPPRRLVTPADDEARLLSSDVAAENAFPFAPRQPRLPAAAGGEPARQADLDGHRRCRPGRASARWLAAPGPVGGSGGGDSVVTPPLRPVAAAASSPPVAPGGFGRGAGGTGKRQGRCQARRTRTRCSARWGRTRTGCAGRPTSRLSTTA